MKGHRSLPLSLPMNQSNVNQFSVFISFFLFFDKCVRALKCIELRNKINRELIAIIAQHIQNVNVLFSIHFLVLCGLCVCVVIFFIIVPFGIV